MRVRGQNFGKITWYVIFMHGNNGKTPIFHLWKDIMLLIVEWLVKVIKMAWMAKLTAFITKKMFWQNLTLTRSILWVFFFFFAFIRNKKKTNYDMDLIGKMEATV